MMMTGEWFIYGIVLYHVLPTLLSLLLCDFLAGMNGWMWHLWRGMNTFDHTLTENDFRDGLLSVMGFLTYLHPFTWI